METFLIFSLIVFGVLQIILFFKIWGMTNCVSSIDRKLEKNKSYHYYMLSGEKDKAFETVKEELTFLLLRLWENAYNKEDFMATARREMESYLKKAELTGFELPAHLKDVELFHEYIREL